MRCLPQNSCQTALLEPATNYFSGHFDFENNPLLSRNLNVATGNRLELDISIGKLPINVFSIAMLDYRKAHGMKIQFSFRNLYPPILMR